MPDLLDIIGQDTVLTQLQRAAGGDRRPHGWLFAGPDGVGRRTTAVELARWILCEEPAKTPNGERFDELPRDFPLRQGCGVCNSCTTTDAGTNADLQIVTKELAQFHEDSDIRKRKMQALGIEVIRTFLIDPAHRASVGGRGKVFIVLEAELMSVAAQNALLKTLEEPPDGVTLILVCTRPEDLLPTTRSRCQIVRFGPLPTDFIVERLSGDGIEAGQTRFWAALTGGSLGDSMALAGTDLYAFKRDLVEGLAAATSGTSGKLAELMVGAMERRSRALVSEADNLAASVAARWAGGLLLTLLGSVYRDALRVACGADGPTIHVDQPGPIRKIADRFCPDALVEILAQLSRYEQLIWRNVNVKLLWDNVAVTCTSAAALGV